MIHLRSLYVSTTSHDVLLAASLCMVILGVEASNWQLHNPTLIFDDIMVNQGIRATANFAGDTLSLTGVGSECTILNRQM